MVDGRYRRRRKSSSFPPFLLSSFPPFLPFPSALQLRYRALRSNDSHCASILPVSQTAYRPPSTISLIPPVIKNLLIINALVFVGQFSLGELLLQWFALWPVGTPDAIPQAGEMAAVPQFYPWQLVTSAFMHGGVGHLLFNMFALWMFGMRIEHALGARRFLFFYLACVLGASLLQLLVTSAPFLFGIGEMAIVPTLGASGGVLGVLAAFGLLYPDEPIYLYFFVPIPAKWLVLGMAAFDLYAGVSGTQAGVANFAHIGGMLVGAMLIQYWRGRLPFKPRLASR